MRTINYQSYFDFGKGVDSIAETARGQAVEMNTAQTMQGAGGQAVRFRLDIVESQEHFLKSLSVSSSASLRYGIPAIAGAGGSAKMDFAQENSFNEYNLNVLARVSVQNPVLMLKSPKLRPEAAQLYSRSVGEFERRYGDTFISGLHTGGEFFGLIVIETRDTVSKSAIHANLSASGAFGAWGGAFQTDISSGSLRQTGSKKVSVLIMTSGGGGTIASDVEGMIAMAKDFPNKVAAAGDARGWPFAVDLMEYKYIDLPTAANSIDLERQRELLTYLGNQRTDCITKLKKCQYVLTRPEEFIGMTPEVVQHLTDASAKLSSSLDAIYRQASACFNDYHGCAFSHADFTPIHVSFPERIAGALPVSPTPPPFQKPGNSGVDRLGAKVRVRDALAVGRHFQIKE